MAVWGLVVEMTVGMGERKRQEAYVWGHVEGTREQALAELERRAGTYVPEHPRNPRRRRFFRSVDGFLLVIDGSWQSYSTRFTLAELMEDSAPDGPPLALGATAESAPRREPEPGPRPLRKTAPAPEASDVERDEDGVPVRPSWWGRSDLS